MRTAFLLLPWLLAGLVCAIWVLQSDHFSAAHGLALILWLGGAWLVHAELRRQPEGLLAWDGQSWNWETQGGVPCVGGLRPRLDWQQGLLLEFQSLDGRSFWLWLERGMAPLMWESLRRAVYAPTAPAPSALPARQEAGS
ncbi:MAG: hypothetical protein HYX45_04065 [Burkholderiales bacterium]|nr:hypothetical protein [Burkholderiales bacterium]